MVRGDHRRAAVDLGEVPVHHRELGQRPHDGEPDEVGEGDLAAARPPQLVVDHQAVVGQQLRRHGAHRRRRRHLQRRLHVLDDHRRGTAQRRRRALLDRRRRARGLRGAARGGLLGGDSGTGCAGAASGREPRSPRAVGPPASSSPGAAASPRAPRLPTRRRRTSRRPRRRRRAVAAVSVPVSRPVVGEEVVPRRVDRSRVVEETLVHLLDEPFVGAELAGLAGHTAAGHAENRLDRIASSLRGLQPRLAPARATRHRPPDR